jgi:hypothetical protein
MNTGQIQLQGSYEVIKDSENDFSNFLGSSKSLQKDDESENTLELEVRNFSSISKNFYAKTFNSEEN